MFYDQPIINSAILRFLTMALIGFAIAEVRADISATHYFGHGIIATEAPTVRMVSVRVGII